MNSPSVKDLATVMVKPRETMRRVLDSGPHRWGLEIAALACIASSVGDNDVRGLKRIFPDLNLSSTLSLVFLGLIVAAILWVINLLIVSGVAMLVGRVLGGQATFGDVRTALGWSLVPIIWSLIFRVPAAVYLHRIPIDEVDPHVLFINFLANGGFSLILMLVAVKLVVAIWVLVLASFCMAEAFGFSSEKGAATVAIIVLIPIVAAAALVLS